MNNRTDTIVAIATPPGKGGVAMLRLSGRNALPVTLKICSVETLKPRHATYCLFRKPNTAAHNSSPLQNDLLDDGIAIFYPAPHSYTGEDTVEISCHGSKYVQETLLQLFIQSGARLAEPGEFTMRAFANGRIDLSQAEAIGDLIDAVAPSQHRLAISQLRGSYASELKELRSNLVNAASMLELELDFSQEDVEFVEREKLVAMLNDLQRRVERLVHSFATGNALREGIPVAIVGSPNAGKSSLLNALVGDDRAIVSPYAGTTRDTIEDCLYFGNHLFRIIDTAGLRHTSDAVEALGIERSRRAIEMAYIIIYVHDSTTPFSLPNELLGKHLIVVHNKCDLLPADAKQKSEFTLPCENATPIYASALTGEGLDDIKNSLTLLASSIIGNSDDALVSNARHRQELTDTAQAISHVLEGIENDMPTDLVMVDLRDALYHLGTITGDIANDEVLQNIFSHFCIGK